MRYLHSMVRASNLEESLTFFAMLELLQKGERLAPQEPWASMENTGSW